MPKLSPRSAPADCQFQSILVGVDHQVFHRRRLGAMNDLVLGGMRWGSIVDLVYELLRRLIGPENWVEEILVFVASALLWRVLTGQGRRGNPASHSQPPEERRTLATSHQTRAAYPRESDAPILEKDGTGCRDEFVNQILVPVILIVVLVLLVGLVGGCR